MNKIIRAIVVAVFIMVVGVFAVPAGKVMAASFDNSRSGSTGVTVNVVQEDKKTGWTQFRFDITNSTGQPICDWIIKLKVSGDAASKFKCWSSLCVIDGEYIYLYPMRDKTNAVITGTELNGYVPGGGFSTDIAASDVVVESVTFNYGSTSTVDYSSGGSSDDDSNSGGSGDLPPEETDTSIYTLPADCVDDATSTPYSVHGKLSVNMSSLKIVDENGNPFQLRGISSHGINWGGTGQYQNEYINFSSIKKTRDLLNANAIRLAMYTDEFNGYANNGDKTNLKYRIDKGVKCATALGMYAIVDWHILDANPKTHIDEAKEFWGYISNRYKDNNHVLYEICNEPTSGIWNDIKEYAEVIIPIIRANDPDAIIIVGTPTWSQDVDIAMNNPLKDSDGTLMDNVMYTIHFYAYTHGDIYRTKMTTAWNTIPIFCTEFGMCDSGGAGSNDFDSASTWLNLMDEHCISYFVWSLCEKDETASLIQKNKNAPNTWTESDLSESGNWIKIQYTARKAVNNTIPENGPVYEDPETEEEDPGNSGGGSSDNPGGSGETGGGSGNSESSSGTVSGEQGSGSIDGQGGATSGVQGSQNIKASDMTVTADIKGASGVEVSGTYKLALKKTMNVVVSFSPEEAEREAITVTSSNPKVVAVVGTKLIAKKTGTSRITVVSENGLTKTFAVKVMKKAVKRLKIKAAKKTVKVGKAIKLKATAKPSKKASNKVCWKSSNVGIATVAGNGTVTGIKKGKVKITATAVDGSGKKASITIKVK